MGSCLRANTQSCNRRIPAWTRSMCSCGPACKTPERQLSRLRQTVSCLTPLVWFSSDDEFGPTDRDQIAKHLAAVMRRPHSPELPCRDIGGHRNPNSLNAKFETLFWRYDAARSEEHTSELQSPMYLVCRL